MAQADSALSTVYDLVSRQPRYPAGLDLAHLALIRAIAATTPEPIVGDADACEVQRRADHLDKVFNALRTYVATVANDTAHHSRVPIDAEEISGWLANAASDAVGLIQNAADRYPCTSRRFLVRYFSETAR